MSEEPQSSTGSRAGAWIGGVLLVLVIYVLAFGPMVSFSMKWGYQKQGMAVARTVYAPLGLVYMKSELGKRLLNDYVHWWDKVAGVPPTHL